MGKFLSFLKEREEKDTNSKKFLEGFQITTLSLFSKRYQNSTLKSKSLELKQRKLNRSIYMHWYIFIYRT